MEEMKLELTLRRAELESSHPHGGEPAAGASEAAGSPGARKRLLETGPAAGEAIEECNWNWTPSIAAEECSENLRESKRAKRDDRHAHEDQNQEENKEEERSIQA